MLDRIFSRARRGRLALEPAASRGPARRSSIAPACSAVGYDVLFTDPSREDPGGDQALEAMAAGGAGRFLFASARLHPDYDAASSLRASQAPGAFALTPDPQDDPTVALLLPYGDAMAQFSAIANVSRNEDGVLRDIPLAGSRRRLGIAGIAAAPGDERDDATAEQLSGDRAAELAGRNAPAARQRRQSSDRRRINLRECGLRAHPT